MQDESVFTLLIATYDVPEFFSFLAMYIHAFARVNPWILCIVIALENLKESYSHSFTLPNVSGITVIGHMGTHWFMLLQIDGPV